MKRKKVSMKPVGSGEEKKGKEKSPSTSAVATVH
jgi:hypothetical protein